MSVQCRPEEGLAAREVASGFLPVALRLCCAGMAGSMQCRVGTLWPYYFSDASVPTVFTISQPTQTSPPARQAKKNIIGLY